MRNKITRTLQLGRLAQKAAAVKLGKQTKDEARHTLAAEMGKMHGIPQKIGQILSIGEMVNGQNIYTRLTESTNILPFPTVRSLLEQSFNCNPDQVFRMIEEEGVSASLGQVHRALLKDGRKVAVKIQYPGIAEATRLDLKALGWITAPVGGLKKGFDLKAYQGEVGRMITEELDYVHEAKMIRLFKGWTAGWEGLEIPVVEDALSRDNVLVMSWLEGEPLSAAKNWPLGERRQLSETLLRFFLKGCLQWGSFHGDPHSGNFRFSHKDGTAKVGVLDFGCVKEMTALQSSALRELILEVIEGRFEKAPELAYLCFVELGFKPEYLWPLRQKLGLLSGILFEPFRSHVPFNVKGWELGKFTESLLGSHRWNFRFAGPADLIWLMRAFQGIIQYLKALDAPVSWRKIFEEVALRAPRLDPAKASGEAPVSAETLSKNLRIRITQKGALKVDLTFKAELAGDLPDLIPEEIAPKLRERDIDLQLIAEKAVSDRFKPGNLFQMAEGEKNIKVWLE